MKKAALIIISILFLLFINSCRISKDDPLLSLRSRTSRLTGSWKIEKLNGYIDFYDQSGQKLYWCQCLFDPELFKSLRYSKTSYSTYYYGYYYIFKNLQANIKIDKNYTTSTSIRTNGHSINSDGTWEWVDDYGKKKEYVMLSDLNIIMKDLIYYASDLTHFLLLPVNIEEFEKIHYFKIDALSNNEMHLSLSDKIENKADSQFSKICIMFKIELSKN